MSKEAEDKAKELVESFIRYTPNEFELEYAVECALICANEILELDVVKVRIGLSKHWEEVKQHLNDI